MSKHSPNNFEGLAAKIIAVGSEGTASALFPAIGAAFAAGTPGIGLLIVGCWAALIAAKNEAQAASADETQADVEALLTSLIADHKSLRKPLA